MQKPNVWRPRQGQRVSGPSVWRGRDESREPETAEASGKTRKRRKYVVQINEAWCKSCGICSAFCPTGTLVDDGDGEPRIADMDLCNGCQLCVVRCPDFAIVVEERSSDNGG